MEYSDFLNGYMKSGGWRFGGKPTSTDTFKSLYTPEAYNGGLLDKVGNPFKQGAVDKALNKEPVSTAATTGLLGGGDGSHDYANRDTPWDQVLDDPTAAGKTFQELTPDQRAAAQAKVDPWGIGPVVAGALLGSPIGMAAQGLAGLFDDALGRTNVDYQSGSANAARNYSSTLGYTADQIAAMQDQDQRMSQGGISYNPAGNMNPTGYAADGMGPPSSAAVDSYSGSSGFGAGYDAGATGTAAENSARSDGGDYGWAKGGSVTKNRLIGPNPKGPDQGFGALQSGEYVIKKDAVKKYGKGLLDDINSMTFKGGK